MTARGTAALVARLQRDLGERDLDVLRSLYRLRLLTTDQIRRLHFAENSPSTQARRTRELLRRLHGLKLVVRLDRQVGGVRSGSRGYVFGLTGLGLATLNVPGQFGQRRRTIWQTKPYFQDHMLAVAKVYTQLVEACRHNQVELLTFDAEPACWRRFHGPGGETMVLKPDAFVRVALDDYELATFVEVDLGTESLPTIRRKCASYVGYWRSGMEQQRSGVFPRVVWLVPTEHRLAGLVEVLRQFARTGAEALFAAALVSEGPTLLSSLPTPSGAAS